MLDGGGKTIDDRILNGLLDSPDEKRYGREVCPMV